MKYKVLVQGYRIVEVEADSAEDVYDKFWDSPAHEEADMFNTEIEEVVPADEPLVRHTDFN